MHFYKVYKNFNMKIGVRGCKRDDHGLLFIIKTILEIIIRIFMDNFLKYLEYTSSYNIKGAKYIEIDGQQSNNKEIFLQYS